uniref:Fibrinogen C-terminal domain-containing protein n=1 Tax=viral metagenome TaxID=1070528 RepID=A0A6M3LJG7_9ZZZZ
MSRGAGRGNVIIDSLPDNKYKVSDVDNAGDPEYCGFLHASGGWYIIEITGGTEYRYAKGDADYATNWTGRAELSYGYYSETF